MGPVGQGRCSRSARLLPGLPLPLLLQAASLVPGEGESLPRACSCRPRHRLLPRLHRAHPDPSVSVCPLPHHPGPGGAPATPRRAAPPPASQPISCISALGARHTLGAWITWGARLPSAAGPQRPAALGPTRLGTGQAGWAFSAPPIKAFFQVTEGHPASLSHCSPPSPEPGLGFSLGAPSKKKPLQKAW